MTTEETIKSRLIPFKYPKFRRFFAAQGFSLVGTWMQELTKSLIVLHLIEGTGGMGKSSAIGMLLMASAIPNLLLGSAGGVLADKGKWKKTLVITQILLAATAFFLGALVSTGHIAYWHLVLFAICEGIILAFDMPAFQQITPQLVPREHFQKALALNTTNFHLARVLGPSLAGVMVGAFGTSSVFWFNAFTFVIVAIVLARIHLDVDHRHAPQQKGQGSMKEAIHYIKNHPIFLRIFAQFLLVQIIVFPILFTTLRVLVQERFKLSDRDFGLVFAMPGAGALLGSLGFLALNPKNPIKVLPFSICGIVVFVAAMAEAGQLWVMVACLFCFSTSMFLTMSALLVTVQLRVDDRYRGRVSALVGMAFASLSPIMAFPMGILSDMLGGRRLLWCSATVFALASAYLALSAKSNNEKAALA